MVREYREDVLAALAEIRRESYKVAFIYASLDAVCVLLAVNLAAGVLAVPALDADVAASAFASLDLPAPDVSTLAAAVAGAATFLGEVALRVRRPVAERFEDANPEIEEALRTARDIANAGRSNPMAKALYADVLARLRNTSSVGLLDTTRLAATVVVALALSLATVQTAVVGLDLGATPTGSGSGGSVEQVASADISEENLRDGDEVLGEPTNVSAGSENLTAEVGASPGGDGDREWNYDRDATDGATGSADAQRAGFSPPERVEDAALVQRYARELERNATDD